MKVAVLSMTAAGVGLTLTAATSVMFAELHWTPGVLAQAEDRCHRISQKNSVHVMYLVCEDSNLSVDMQLWHMLGRKTNNLGRVVDGATDAGLDAQKSSGSTMNSPHNRSLISGQDELQSFFANNAHKDGKQGVKTPTKGTIMSFFAKQRSAEKLTASPVVGAEMKTTLPASLSKIVEWDCEACTFHNSQRRPRFGDLRCEMCQFQYFETNMIDLTANDTVQETSRVKLGSMEKTTLNLFISYGSGKSENLSNVVDLTENDAVQANRSVTLRNIKKTTLNQFNPCGLGKPENVILDVDGNKEYDINSCRGDGLLDVTALQGKKRKLPDQPIQNDESHGKHTSLSFAVSNNTGRVTIHYAATGQSSLVNFDIEHIVTDETMDKMMEAKLRRNESSLSLQLIYNDAAIKKRYVGLFLVSILVSGPSHGFVKQCLSNSTER